MSDNKKLQLSSLYGEICHDVDDKDTSSIYEDVMITDNINNIKQERSNEDGN